MSDIKQIVKELKKKIEEFQVSPEIESVGTVVKIGDGIALIQGLSDIMAGELIEFPGGVAGVALNLEENSVGAVVLGPYEMIKEGDVVRFTLENQTMMHHPMHLHGHFFRVLNKNGESSPLKHTVDVPPHGTRTIEFLANEPGEWMLHCHNLYHLKTGMARVVKYSSYTPKPEIAHWQKHDPHMHEHLYLYGNAEVATNHAQANARVMRTWDQIEGRFEARADTAKPFSFEKGWELEGDLFYRRWFGQYFNVLGGATAFDKRFQATLGIGYTLPMLIKANAFIDHRAKFRVDLEKRFQWLSHIFTDVDFTWRPAQVENGSTAIEYEITLMYAPNWNWSIGLMLTDMHIGGGVQVQF